MSPIQTDQPLSQRSVIRILADLFLEFTDQARIELGAHHLPVVRQRLGRDHGGKQKQKRHPTTRTEPAQRPSQKHRHASECNASFEKRNGNPSRYLTRELAER